VSQLTWIVLTLVVLGVWNVAVTFYLLGLIRGIRDAQ